jgi:hypothetical protein
MTKRTDKRGRRKGSRTKGYFYRTGRGWFTKDKGGAFVRLLNEAGEPLRDENTPKDVIADAAYRIRRDLKTQPKQPSAGSGTTVEEVCNYYLDHAKRENRKTTYDKRADTLFDFCYGLSAKWRTKSEAERSNITKQDRLTVDGKPRTVFGKMAVSGLRRHHLEAWLNEHPGWNDRRTRLQAVRRALNLAAEDGLIAANPIEKFRVPQGRARVTYLSPEQEGALLKAARPAFKVALKVLIRTGMRPGEFAAVTSGHIFDQGDRMELRFTPEETKSFKLTGRVRAVKITDPEIMGIVRTQAKMNGPGAIFRTQTGQPWKTHYLSQSFRRAKRRAEKAGMKFDPDCCVYSARHTYGKRMLTGYWTGKPINIDLLSAMMGNTPEVARRHYVNILKSIDGVEELIWAAC